MSWSGEHTSFNFFYDIYILLTEYLIKKKEIEKNNEKSFLKTCLPPKKNSGYDTDIYTSHYCYINISWVLSFFLYRYFPFRRCQNYLNVLFLLPFKRCLPSILTNFHKLVKKKNFRRKVYVKFTLPHTVRFTSIVESSTGGSEFHVFSELKTMELKNHCTLSICSKKKKPK